MKYCDVESTDKARVSGKLSGREDNEDNCDKMVMLVHPNKGKTLLKSCICHIPSTCHLPRQMIGAALDFYRLFIKP